MHDNLRMINVLVALKLSSDGHDSWVLSPEGRLARLGKCPVEHRPMQVDSLIVPP
jgi:hypothetical protein